MSALYSALDWGHEAAALAAVDNLLRHTLGSVEPGVAEQFRPRFEQARYLEVPQTGFSPLMLYTLYGIAAARRPRRLFGCGTYAGVAFSLLAAGAVDHEPAASAVGVEEDAEALSLAVRNARAMRLQDVLKYERRPADELPGGSDRPIDLLFLDVDHPVRGKEDYPRLAALAHPHLTAGAVLLAHDACVPRCQRDLDNLTAFVKNTGQYRGPWVLPIDKAGLWMAVRS